MSKITSIQWADSTVNPIMGCGGCELFPKPEIILKKLDLGLAEISGKWRMGDAKRQYRRIIDRAFEKIGHPDDGQRNEVTTTSIHHARDLFATCVDDALGPSARQVAEKIIAQQVTCYAAKLHLNKGRSLLNPGRKIKKGYAPTFEVVTQFPGRVEECAKFQDLLGRGHEGEPWKERLPRLVFVSDMGDAFSSRRDFGFLEKDVVPHFQSEEGKRHLWLWLTKRPQIMATFAKRIGGFPDNVCAMTTLTGGEPDNLARLKSLKEVDAPIRGLSVEPLWSRIDPDRLDLSGIDWLILGGESGSGRAYTRDFHLEWAEELREHCEKSGVAFFLKQLGRNPVWKGERFKILDPHGGEWGEWPAGFRVRQFPRAFHEYRKKEMVVSTMRRPTSAKEASGLTRQEAQELKKLEKIVIKGANTFLQVGAALFEIKAKELYRGQFQSFKEYCEDRLGFSRAHAYRLLDAWQTKAELDPVTAELQLEPISTERQLRALKPVVKAGNHRQVLKELARRAVDAEFTDDDGAGLATGRPGKFSPGRISFSALESTIQKVAGAGTGNGNVVAPRNPRVGHNGAELASFRVEVSRAVRLLKKGNRKGALGILEALLEDGG